MPCILSFIPNTLLCFCVVVPGRNRRRNVAKGHRDRRHKGFNTLLCRIFTRFLHFFTLLDFRLMPSIVLELYCGFPPLTTMRVSLASEARWQRCARYFAYIAFVFLSSTRSSSHMNLPQRCKVLWACKCCQFSGRSTRCVCHASYGSMCAILPSGVMCANFGQMEFEGGIELCVFDLTI